MITFAAMAALKQKIVETELCAYSVEACRIAAACGVLRAELCASPWEGGTTPSAAAIELAREVGGLRLHVMIRPRGGDFLYSEEEFRQMLREVRFARRCGADGVVAGVLTAGGDVDVVRTRRLVEEAEGMDVTFHRAFDMTRDILRALDDIAEAGCSRILTSGGCNTAAEGAAMLRELVLRAGGRLTIMAGSGIRPGNVAEIVSTGVGAVHFSARALHGSGMAYRKESISMGGSGSVPEYGYYEADPETVRAIVRSAGGLNGHTYIK